METLRRAAAGERHAMSHAWLVTGPPGSGRSNAAGPSPRRCSASGRGVGGLRAVQRLPDLAVRRASRRHPGPHRAAVDRGGRGPRPGPPGRDEPDHAAPAGDRGRGRRPGHRARRGRPAEEHRGAGAATVWILCAPDRRRRGRHHPLAVPPAAARHPDRGRRGPAAGQPGRGRAGAGGLRGPGRPGPRRPGPGAGPGPGGPRAAARVLQIPFGLPDLGACLAAAAQLVEACTAEATAATEPLDARERAALEEALGFGTAGARPRQAQAALKELEDQQKARAKRFQRDAIDRALTELTGFYRDVLSIQTRSGAALVNAELAPQLATLARKSTPSRRCAGSTRCSAAGRAGGQCGPAAGGRVHPDRPGRGLIRAGHDRARSRIGARAPGPYRVRSRSSYCVDRGDRCRTDCRPILVRVADPVGHDRSACPDPHLATVADVGAGQESDH